MLLGTLVDTIGEAVKDISGRLKLARNLDWEPDIVADEQREGAHDGKSKIPSKDSVGDDVGSQSDKGSNGTEFKRQDSVIKRRQKADIRKDPFKPALLEDLDIGILNLNGRKQEIGRVLLHARNRAKPAGKVPPLECC